MNKIKKYGLIGYPIEGSLSPLIHNSYFEKNNYNSKYLLYSLREGELESFIKSLDDDIKGFNVTLPYKENIIDYLDDLDSLSRKIGAVNTVDFKNKNLKGYNTDAYGFIKSLKDEDIDYVNKNILLLGAGGAARAISYILLENASKDLYIANRTIGKADKLVEDLKIYYDNRIEARDLFNLDLDKSQIDLVINTTSVGMYPLGNESPISLEGFKEESVFYDLIYKPLETKFLKDARKKGYKTYNGLGMLVNQALLSQEIWRDEKIEESMFTYMRELIGREVEGS